MEFTIPQLAQFVDVDYEYLRKCIIDNNMAINDAVDKSVEKAKPYVPYRQLNSVVKKRKIQKTNHRIVKEVNHDDRMYEEI